jgi:hypothetical protein
MPSGEMPSSLRPSSVAQKVLPCSLFDSRSEPPVGSMPACMRSASCRTGVRPKRAPSSALPPAPRRASMASDAD